ncbi:2962_t:CDS:2, partial [Gigaspora rosea]
TPYLLAGTINSLMSLAWFSGPLAGLLVQPIVGILSDNSTSKYGSEDIVDITVLLFGWPLSPFTSINARGYINLEYFFPFFGGTQLQVPCVFTSIILLVFDALTCWATPEKFPFLFYTTSWVAEIYIHTIQAQQQLPFNDPINSKLKEEAERTCPFSLLLFSIVSMTASFKLPFLVTSSVSNALIIFLETIFEITFVSTIFQADLVIGLCGISWAVAMWAPFSIIGEFAAKQTKVGGSNDNSAIISSTTVSRNASRLDLIGSVHRSDDDDGAEYEELENMREVSVVDDGNMEDMQFLDHNQFDDESIQRGRSTRNDLSNNSFDAGILLGINNIYCHTTVLLLYFFSSAAFALVKHHDHITPGNNSNETTIDAMNGPTQKEINAGVDSIGFVLICGCCMAIIARFL